MNYNNPIINGSTVTIRVMCAIVFAGFSFAWLYFFQADMLAMMQHVLSNGRTIYRPLLATVVLTVFLLLIQQTVYALVRLKKRFHALTYVPSMLVLALITDVDFLDATHVCFQWSWWLPVVVMLVWLPVVSMARVYQEVEDNPGYSLLSRPMWINMLLLALQMMFVVWLGNTNAVLHYRIKTEQLLANEQYKKALEVGKKSVESDADLLMLRMYAMARENSLGEQLFEYPVTGTSADILPTDGRNRLSLCPADNLYRFLGARPATPMAPMRYLELLLANRSSVNNKQSIVNYYLCGLLIDRQLDRFAREIGNYFTLDDHLPKHYREALVIYAHSTSHPVVVYHHAVTEEDWRNLQELERQYPLESERKGRVEEQYRGTYWYYYKYEL
jgi:hypothetical protein